MDKPGLPHNGVPEKTKLRLASKEQVHNNEEVYGESQVVPCRQLCNNSEFFSFCKTSYILSWVLKSNRFGMHKINIIKRNHGTLWIQRLTGCQKVPKSDFNYE